MIVAHKIVCLPLVELALLAAVAAVVVAVEAASKLAHPLLVMRAGVVTNGLLASQMALAGEHAMMQIAVALFRGSRRSCKHAPMKEAAMME